MSCITARLTCAGAPTMDVGVWGYEANCTIAPSDVSPRIDVDAGVASSVWCAENVAMSIAYRPAVKVRVAMICDVGEDVVLRFDREKLTWEGTENNINVTKYNILIASEDWSLGELIIEELL